MKDILLAIDREEERARTQAKTILELFDTDSMRPHLLHVFVDNPEGASVTELRAIRTAENVFSDAGFETELHETAGDPASEIISTAQELDAAGICVAGRKRSPAGKMLFGSVTQEVILSTSQSRLVETSAC